MILIADAGSTKTSWVMVNSERMLIGKFESGGLNPMVFDNDTLSKNIARNTEMFNHAPYIRKIYLYGAGVDDQTAHDKLYKVLTGLFDKAEVEIYSDMLAAARATAGNEPGIVSILGTGSNSCYYDGKEIRKTIGYYGYMLMDDASGNWFGKQLLRDFIFERMPKQLRQQFKQKFNLKPEVILENLYHNDQPNTYLATFSMFMSEHYKSRYIKDLLLFGFDNFITRELAAYDNYKELPLHFNGSIAYHFQKELKEVMDQYGLKSGKIIKNPIEELINYHV